MYQCSVSCPFPILFRIFRCNRRRPVWGRSCRWDRQHKFPHQRTAFLRFRRTPVSSASCIHRDDRWKRLLQLRYRHWDRSCRRNRKRLEIFAGIFEVWACRYLVHPLFCTGRRRNRSIVVRQDTVSPGFRPLTHAKTWQQDPQFIAPCNFFHLSYKHREASKSIVFRCRPWN